MEEPVILGGGYTCSVCGQYNRTSALCHHDMFIPKQEKIKINNHMSNNEEFVPYAEALALKELGFDEKCCAIYRDFDKSKSPYIEFAHVNKKGEMTFLSNSDAIWMLTIPTYSQAFRWFREKYDLIVSIERNRKYKNIKRYEVLIDESTDDKFDKYGMDYYDTYEEAELACLKKLIEIVKNK